MHTPCTPRVQKHVHTPMRNQEDIRRRRTEQAEKPRKMAFFLGRKYGIFVPATALMHPAHGVQTAMHTVFKAKMLKYSHKNGHMN